MMITRSGIVVTSAWNQSNPGTNPLPLASHHKIEVSHLSDDNIQRIREILKTISEKIMHAPQWKIVYVNGKGGGYWRRAPGAAKIEKALGSEFFELFGALASVGIQAYEDAQRTDLDGSQKLGRASLALLAAVTPPLGLVLTAATIMFPTETDKFTAAIFSSKDPVVAGLSDAIVAIGGIRFQNWAAKPSWIDFF